MTGQGWMVDDGICEMCGDGLCYLCDKPIEWPTDDGGKSLSCCCDEGYHIGYVQDDGP
jgi:hypothetical protein